MEHFNAGEFFAAHEVLERLWIERDCDPFWQGLILFAAAFEKARRGSAAGARKHLEATLTYLEPFVPGREGIDVRPVLGHARSCLDLLAGGTPLAELPRFRMPPPRPPYEVVWPPASEAEIRQAVLAALRGERRAPSVLKDALLRLHGRAGRTRVEPIVRELSGQRP